MQVNRFPLVLSQCVMIQAQQSSGEYVRYQGHTCYTVSALSIKFNKFSLSHSGAVTFQHTKYGLHFGDGVDRGPRLAMADTTTTTNVGTFVGNLDTLPDGPYMLTIVPLNPDGTDAFTLECCVPYWVWVDRNGTAKDHPDVFFQNNSYDWTRYGDGPTYLWYKTQKSKLKTRTVPLGFRNIPVGNEPFYGGDPFNTPSPPRGWQKLMYAPVTNVADANLHRPMITKRGITVTDGYSGYFRDWMRENPRQPMLDGERGQATVFNMLAGVMGHSAVLYGIEPHSFWAISAPNGKKRTLAGLRHTGPMAPHWKEMEGNLKFPFVGTEIVGLWDDSIPMAQRFGWEGWALFVDPRTTVVDPANGTAERPPFGIQPLHPGPVVFFQTCRFGRLLRYEHSLTPGEPVKVSVWVSGLKDPWGAGIRIENGKGVIYINERLGHCISKWSADTPQTPLGVLIENPSGSMMGGMDASKRRWWSPYPIDMRRTHNILAPEGMAIMDNILYFGSGGTQDVREINLDTGEQRLAMYVPYSDVQSAFVNVVASDGTFMPRHTLFTTTFDNQTNGRPRVWLPQAAVEKDGKPATHKGGVAGLGGLAYHVLQGAGGKYDNSIYPLGMTPPANGMFAFSTTGPGIDVWMQAPVGATPPDYAKIERGWSYYQKQGYKLVHGNYGYGYLDEPLPWGEDPDLDYALEQWGHSKVVVEPPPPPPPPPPPEPPTLEERVTKLETRINAAGIP